MRDRICHIEEHRCLVELHCHLDGALSIASVRRLAQMQGIEIPASEEELAACLMVPEGCRDLNEFLEKFEFPNRLLQTAEGIRQAVAMLLAEMRTAGMIYAEIRFAPQLSTVKGLTQAEAVQAAIEGIRDAGAYPGEKSEPEILAQLILCCMRGDCHEENLETVRTAANWLGKGVCAVDLAGAEGLFPTKDFTAEFELARTLGVPATIHAGEADGPDSVSKALDLGAVRIGHGVRAFEDPAVTARLAAERVPLELCPTSNLLTCIYGDLSEYPIRRCMEAGIPVSVNTDDPTCCHTDLQREWRLLTEAFSLTEAEAEKILLDTAEAAFADVSVKDWMKRMIREDFSREER